MTTIYHIGFTLQCRIIEASNDGKLGQHGATVLPVLRYISAPPTPSTSHLSRVATANRRTSTECTLVTSVKGTADMAMYPQYVADAPAVLSPPSKNGASSTPAPIHGETNALTPISTEEQNSIHNNDDTLIHIHSCLGCVCDVGGVFVQR